MNESGVELYLGDCIEWMGDMPDKSVQLILTSPPYGDMYFGLTTTECRELIQSMVRESERLLVEGGKLVINVNNYVTSKKNGCDQRQIIPMTKWIQDVCTLIYQDEIFWIKGLGQAGRAKPLFGSYPYPPNFLMSQRIEYILVWGKKGKRVVEKEIKERSALTTDEWREWTQNAWKIQGVHNKDHDAPFPEELPRRLIKLYSFVGDIVLDPFMGSGTTGVECGQLERKFIGIEINEQHFQDAKYRISMAYPNMAKTPRILAPGVTVPSLFA